MRAARRIARQADRPSIQDAIASRCAAERPSDAARGPGPTSAVPASCVRRRCPGLGGGGAPRMMRPLPRSLRRWIEGGRPLH